MNEILLLPLIVLLYMIGGQCFKIVRRYLLPLVAGMSTLLKDKDMTKREKLRLLSYALLALILTMGYGENSKLKKICGGIEWVTRLAYGFLVSVPFLIMQAPLYISPILMVCYSVRAGSLGQIKIGSQKYDVLIEDIFRGSGIALAVTLTF